SKAVTSVTILSLARDGLIDLNAPVNEQLKTWTLPENDFTRQAAVTPIRLMNHSGGTVFSPGFPYRTEDLPTFEQILEGEPPARSGPVRVDRVPGTTFQYSNPGYAVLRKLAEDVTGKDFPEIAAERIFEPLGMSRTTFVTPLPQAMLANAAMGHQTDGTVDAEVRRWCGHMAAGGLWTTATDYAAFVIELQRSLRGESDLVLDRALAELMVQPHDADEYGLGVFLREPKGERRFVGHIGDGPGFVGGFTADTLGDHGVVVLTNGQGGINLVREIRRGVASVYGWPDNLPPALTAVTPVPGLLEKAAGRYKLGFDQVVTLEHSDDALWLQSSTGLALRLFAVSDTAFVCKEREGEITIERDADDSVTQMTYDLSDEIGRRSGGAKTLPRLATGERTPLEVLLDGDTSEATALYRALLESDPSAPAVAENRLNRLGYQFLGQGRPDDAVAVLRLYVALYPESANAYDSLGEALMTAGQLEAAIASYRRSLELNPANGNAVEMIAKIESMV
ncbi:MAG: serine hydrolase, partial [Thermoanaerobaculales bacterium]|nr:serine hydrolase [Thermoanaerobaculales bacterium]